MLLGGLWHGAAWNYVLWGAYQGALLCGHRFLTHGRDTLPTSVEAVSGTTDLHGGAVRAPRLLPAWISTPLRIVVFFVFCCYGWLLFRAHSFDQIRTFTAVLFGFGAGGPSVISKPTTSASDRHRRIELASILRLSGGDASKASSAGGLRCRDCSTQRLSSY